MIRLRAVAVAVGLLCFIGHSVVAHAADSLLVSGESNVAVIDGNGNGPGAGDCTFTANYNDGDGKLSIYPTQDTTNPLLACALEYMGTAMVGQDESSDYAEMNITETIPAGSAGSVPIALEVIDEQGPNPDGLPMSINDALVFDSSQFPWRQIARAIPCDAGGPTVQVTTEDGTFVISQLAFHPDAENPTHLRVRDLPLETTGSGRTMVDAYVPVKSDRTITVEVDNGDDGTMVVDMDLDELPGCPGRRVAPTTTEWGLAALMVALLAGGVWGLGRRRAFCESLPVM